MQAFWDTWIGSGRRLTWPDPPRTACSRPWARAPCAQASAYVVLADLQFKLDHYAEAAPAYDAVARSFDAALGARSMRSINARVDASVSRQYAGQLEDAQAGLATALEVAQSTSGWTAR